MRRLFVFALFATLCTASLASAQGFLSPIPGIDARQPSYIIPKGGERIDGNIPWAAFVNGNLRSLTFKTDDGRKIKFKAADVQELGHKPGALAKLAAMSDQIDNPWDFATADWEGTMGRDWVVFKQALLPGKKRKFALMQLLNPGFDGRIQVFYDAKAAGNDDTVMGISTAPAESYMVVKDDRQSIQIKKRNYRKQFPELFGDCSKMMKEASDRKPKFKNFASAVFAFDQICASDSAAPSKVAASAPAPAKVAAPAASKPAASKPARSGPIIGGSVFGYAAGSENPLREARIEIRPVTPLRGKDNRPAADLLGLAITGPDGAFSIDELHSPSQREAFPLMLGWSYEVKVVAAGHYVFGGIVEYSGEAEPWEFLLEEKSVDVADDSGVVAPDDRALQHGATRRGNR